MAGEQLFSLDLLACCLIRGMTCDDLSRASVSLISSVLSSRVNFRLLDESFQLWCESIETKIIKKIKVNKMRSQSRIFWLTGTYRCLQAERLGMIVCSYARL